MSDSTDSCEDAVSGVDQALSAGPRRHTTPSILVPLLAIGSILFAWTGGYRIGAKLAGKPVDSNISIVLACVCLSWFSWVAHTAFITKQRRIIATATLCGIALFVFAAGFAMGG